MTVGALLVLIVGTWVTSEALLYRSRHSPRYYWWAGPLVLGAGLLVTALAVFGVLCMQGQR